MESPWLDRLKHLVEENPIVVLRFNGTERESLSNSRRGFNEFTFARSHTMLEGLKLPTPCVIQFFLLP